MKIVPVVIFLLVLAVVFGVYPRAIDISNFKTVLIEKRTFNCIERETGTYECPVLKVEVHTKELSEVLSNVWCPFVPLSYEGLPAYDLIFKSDQGVAYELGIRGNELSNYCFVPDEAKEYLERVINSKNTTLTYEKL